MDDLCLRTFFDSQKVRCIAPAEAKKTVWCGVRDGSIVIRDMSNGLVLRRLREKEDFVWCLTDVNSRMWCGYSSGTICIRDAQTGRPLQNVSGHTGGVFCLLWHDDYVFSGSGDWTIRVHRSGGTYTFVRALLGHANSVRCLTWHGDYLWSGSDDYSIRVWDPETGDCYREISAAHERSVLSLCSLKDFVWSGGDEGTIRVWNAKEYTMHKSLQGHRGRVNCLLPLGNQVWSASADRTLAIWNAQTLQSQKVLKEHTGYVSTLARVGWQVWSGSSDKSIRSWFADGIFVQLQNMIKEERESKGDLIARSQDVQALVIAEAEANAAQEHVEELTKQLHEWEQEQVTLVQARDTAEAELKNVRLLLNNALAESDVCRSETVALRRRKSLGILKELHETLKSKDQDIASLREELRASHTALQQQDEDLEDRTLKEEQLVLELTEQLELSERERELMKDKLTVMETQVSELERTRNVLLEEKQAGEHAVLEAKLETLQRVLVDRERAYEELKNETDAALAGKSAVIQRLESRVLLARHSSQNMTVARLAAAMGEGEAPPVVESIEESPSEHDLAQGHLEEAVTLIRQQEREIDVLRTLLCRVHSHSEIVDGAVLDETLTRDIATVLGITEETEPRAVHSPSSSSKRQRVSVDEVDSFLIQIRQMQDRLEEMLQRMTTKEEEMESLAIALHQSEEARAALEAEVEYLEQQLEETNAEKNRWMNAAVAAGLSIQGTVCEEETTKQGVKEAASERHANLVDDLAHVRSTEMCLRDELARARSSEARFLERLIEAEELGGRRGWEARAGDYRKQLAALHDSLAVDAGFIKDLPVKRDARPSPTLVGKAFVRDYYRRFTDDPSSIAYLCIEGSVMVYGEENKETDLVLTGPDRIREAWRMINPTGSYVDLSVVDCVSTPHGTILIAVLGSITSAEGVCRRFTQNFLLKAQPRGFALVIDTLRLLSVLAQESVDEQLLSLREERDFLAQRLDLASKAANRVSREEELESALLMAQTELQASKSTEEALQGAIRSLQLEVQDVSETDSKQREEIASLMKECHTLRLQAEKATPETERDVGLVQELFRSRSLNESLQVELALAVAELEAMEKDIEHRDALLVTAEGKIEELENLLKESKAEGVKLRSDLRDALASKETAIEEVEDLSRGLQEKTQEEAHLHALQKERDAMVMEEQNKVKTLEQETLMLRRERDALQDAVELVSCERETYQHELNVLRDDAQRWKNTVEHMELERDHIEKLSTMKKEEKEEEEEEGEESYRVALRKSEDACSELRKELDVLRNEKARLQNEVRETTGKLEGMEQLRGPEPQGRLPSSASSASLVAILERRKSRTNIERVRGCLPRQPSALGRSRLLAESFTQTPSFDAFPEAVAYLRSRLELAPVGGTIIEKLIDYLQDRWSQVMMFASPWTVAPKWTPDDFVSACTLCARTFTFFARRHHCRFCGRIFCSECTAKSVAIPFLHLHNVRVCMHCFPLCNMFA